jgi:hypothetical protein
MSSIVSNLTISGFKAFGSDCDGSDFINTTISSSGIYKYQAAAITGSLSQTIYLDGSAAGTRGGAKTVDTLSVMVNTSTVSDRVEINGYVATRGVGSTGATAGGYAINWAVWAPQSTGSGTTPSSTAYGNSPAYTVTAGSGTSYSLSQVLLSGTYNTNQSLSVSEGTNNLVIEIWDSTRTTKRATLTYYVVIVSSSTRLSSLIPTLSPNTLVPGYSYSPAFDSNYCSYSSQVYILNVNPASTSMTLTPNTLVSTGSVISITTPNGTVLAPLLSGDTSSSFNIADNNSVNVSVTAPDGTTVQQYVLSIQSDISGNNLSAASFSYYSTPTVTSGFANNWLSGISPNTANLALYTQFSYLNTIPNISYGISVTLTALDSGSSVAVGSSAPVPVSGTFLVPYSSLIQGAENVIVCRCISSTGVVKLYNFNIWLAGSDVAPSTAGRLSNISFNAVQAVIDPSNPFTSTNICQSSSLNFTNATPGIPTYTVYVAPTALPATSVAVTLVLTYNDNGSRFSVSDDNGTTWDPTAASDLNVNINGDNWTLGSQRTTTVTVVVPILSGANSTGSVIVASHLPGSSGATGYYGYCLNFVTPRANLLGLSLTSYETNSLIALNPTFNSNILSYSAYIGTAANPTNKVNLTALFGSGVVVDWTVVPSGTATTPAYASGTNNLVSGSQSLINLGTIASSYTLYLRLWNASLTTDEFAYYTLNLLNIDQSLILSGLRVFNQDAPNSVTGVFVAPDPEADLSPTFSPTTFVYNAPIYKLYGAIQPTVSSPGVKTITISLNGSDPVPVVSGSYYRFPISTRDIAAQITVTDNLSPINSNSYMVFIYSTSDNLNLSLASFDNILNSSFSPYPLPNGTTITNAITASASPGTSTSSTNAAISTTRFTGTPQQPGTSMYLSTSVGFEPLAPGVASSVITLIPNAVKTVPVWLYCNDNITTGYFNFNITQVPDTNSYLSNMVLTNCTNFVFNPTTQTYNGIILAAPNTSFSFTPTTASLNSTMTWSFNGSSSVSVLSGITVNIANTNYLPSTNSLSIIVSPQSGPSRTYVFNIVRDVNYYLSNLRVFTVRNDALTSTSTTSTAVAINPSPFSPTFYTYSSEVGPSIDTAYVVLSKAPESSISMTNATLLGLNTSNEQVWAVPVQVTTTPQNTLVYSINPSAITVSVGVQSSVYNLAIVRQYPVATAESISLAKNGSNIQLRNQLGVNVDFDPLVFTYTIQSVNSGPVTVSITGQGFNTYYLNGSPYYSPVSGVIISSTTPIVVYVVNQDGSSCSYQFSLLN